MSEYPNYTLTQLAELVLQFDHQEGLSPASLENLKEFAKSALENASQQSVQLTGATCPSHGEPISDLIHYECGCSTTRPAINANR